MKRALAILALALVPGLASCRTGKTFESIVRDHCTGAGHGSDRKCGGDTCGVCWTVISISHKQHRHQEHLCDCARSCTCWSTRP